MLQLLTILIAAAVALIAYMQWQTANLRVLLDLFDRRMKVWENAQQAWRIAMQDTSPNQEALALLRHAVLDSQFIFGKDVEDFLKGMEDTFFRQSLRNRRINAPGVTPGERDRLIEEEQSFLVTLPDQINELQGLCSKYMRVSTRYARTPADMLGKWFGKK